MLYFCVFLLSVSVIILIMSIISSIINKTRIVKRTLLDGRTEYVIQRFWIFGYEDAWMSSLEGVYIKDSFDTLEEAKNNICYFDGTKVKDEIVFINKK